MLRSSIKLTVLVLCIVTFSLLVWFKTKPTDISSALARGQYQLAAQRLEFELEQSDTSARSLLGLTLGNLYFVGLGVPQDYERSGQLYSEAAFSGQVSAQVNMGHIYANGLGVPMDGYLAYAWFNLARDNGSKIAQTYMSDLLAGHKVSGQQVPKIRLQYATLSNFPRLH